MQVYGLCWYLGSPGNSCQQACRAHGDFDERASAFVGTTQQAGSLVECSRILATFGLPDPVEPTVRLDGLGLGCHEWTDGKTYWLDEPSAGFSADASATPLAARIVCACTR